MFIIFDNVAYYLIQSWDLVAHFEPISESTPTVLLLLLVS